MKIVCEKQELMKGINIVQKAVPVRTTMSILECILIEAHAGTIKLTANDMELGIETSIIGRIEEAGMAAINAKLLSEIVRKLPEGEICLTVDELMNVTILCEKATFRISAKEGDDFSVLPDIEKDSPVILSQFTLKEMIRQTIFSISVNESNRIMTGVLFEINENYLRLASLDGHRISLRRLCMKDVFENRKVIVPGKTLQEISKILSGEVESLVEIYFSTNHILFEFEDTVVVSRLIEGNYFNVDRMITTEYEIKVRLNRKEFMECIDRSSLLVREEDKKPLVLNITDGMMDMRIDTQMGSMEESMVVEKEGKDVRIGFNPRFLMDALRVIDEEEITLYFVNSKSPCIIRDEENTYVYLILPINFI